MLLLTILISIPNLTALLVTSNNSISLVNNDSYVSNMSINAFQTSDKVEEITNSTEISREIAVTETDNNRNASQILEAQNNFSNSSIVDKVEEITNSTEISREIAVTETDNNRNASHLLEAQNNFSNSSIADKVEEITNSTEISREIAVTETDDNRNASQILEAQNNFSKPSLVKYYTYHVECEYCLYPYRSFIITGNTYNVDANILFASSDSDETVIGYSDNVFNSNVVVTVNISGCTIKSTGNKFKSNALIILKVFIPFINIQDDEYHKNLSLQIHDNVDSFFVRNTIFHSDLNIIGELSNLKIESSNFSLNFQLTILERMYSLTFSDMREIPEINIKLHLRELHLKNISSINLNSKMHPNIESIAVYFQLPDLTYTFYFGYILSVTNKPTLVLSNIGMQQNANISDNDNEINRIIIFDNENKSFNFSGYSVLKTMYLQVEDSHIIIPPSLKKVYITRQFLPVNLYVSSMEVKIEIENKNHGYDNSKVISKINCHSKSEHHKNVKLLCLKTLPTNLEGILSEAQSFTKQHQPKYFN
ncbi:hypothetical protein GJ496_011487 [Pomphorhynchus laevis]|nr:hypothetical protein GJ496_011487 [Pomphorhynchus laevis]KAI0978177.1 hypothetical protein GJ496_011487 [Pomphorhynchus laevis]